MRKLIFIFFAGVAVSCNNGASTTAGATKDTVATTAATPTVVNYPYTIEHPDSWEMGNTANTVIVLNALKAWEQGNIDESLKYFGDSIHVRFDGLDKKMSKDSLRAFFIPARAGYKTVTIKMEDWESVISKDKSEEWVTVWYKQLWETKKGVKDSVDVINDLKVKDGKIVRLDEYIRKTH